FIELMSDGGLIYPTENLFLLIKQLEEDVLTVVGTKTIKCNTMHQILDKISLRESLPRLGCFEHHKELMVKLINFWNEVPYRTGQSKCLREWGLDGKKCKKNDRPSTRR
ncbi:hypothetical protein PV327_011311, partial [Microctonus hyperodae]